MLLVNCSSLVVSTVEGTGIANRIVVIELEIRMEIVVVLSRSDSTEGEVSQCIFFWGSYLFCQHRSAVYT